MNQNISLAQNVVLTIIRVTNQQKKRKSITTNRLGYISAHIVVLKWQEKMVLIFAFVWINLKATLANDRQVRKRSVFKACRSFLQNIRVQDQVKFQNFRRFSPKFVRNVRYVRKICAKMQAVKFWTTGRPVPNAGLLSLSKGGSRTSAQLRSAGLHRVWQFRADFA